MAAQPCVLTGTPGLFFSTHRHFKSGGGVNVAVTLPAHRGARAHGARATAGAIRNYQSCMAGVLVVGVTASSQPVYYICELILSTLLAGRALVRPQECVYGI